jgi:hypothetical protein
MPQVVFAFLCVVISVVLLIHLWRRQDGSVFKRSIWSIVVCVPLIGWVFYGGFYCPPGSNTVQANGKASGWGSHWPRNY